MLDLRNNPGGYLSQAADIASLLLRSGVVVEVQTKEGSSTKKVSGVALNRCAGMRTGGRVHVRCCRSAGGSVAGQ